jgi:FAS-associated factor 2
MSLRMPSGERVVRKFRADAELEELYAFVECYDLMNDDEIVEEKEVQEPEDYEHVYKFKLVSPMPREVFEMDKPGSLRERIGRSGNLIVEKVIDEDDEEGDSEEEEMN